MPARWIDFGEDIVEIDKLISGDKEALRTADKYAPLPYIMAIAAERHYRKDVISVTTGLNGNRLNWLQRFVNYTINFDSTAFRALGVSVHALLENEDVSPILDCSVEQRIEFDRITGRYDLWYELDRRVLVDYKTVGSFAIVDALGVVESGRKPKLDADGNQEYYQRNGKGYKAGDPKTEKVYTYNIKRGNNLKYRMQGTMYKILLGRSGVPIDEYRVFFIVRDGGLSATYSRGVSKRSYYVQFPFLDEGKTLQFYRDRRDELVSLTEQTEKLVSGDYSNEKFVDAVKKSDMEIPAPCSPEEAWDGRRCSGYCSVASVCKDFGCPYIKGGKKIDEELRNF